MKVSGQNTRISGSFFEGIPKHLFKPKPILISEDPSFRKLSYTDVIYILSKTFSVEEYKTKTTINTLHDHWQDENSEAYLHEGRKKIYFQNKSLSFTIDLKYSEFDKIAQTIQKIRNYVSRLWEKE